ncbi:MAG: ABC transporter permease [Acidiphilium sp. 37-64-53]|jgi:multiple sugar transport system permease protein|uniref:carbohydrate ABC transporter permease n=1 Tax=Acidiphilium TaxID=522 RepID=UPI0004944A66|nr:MULTISPECIES: carbohydrate ABC transporter permease [Acidiphilium]MBW4035175.1 carbohydrate ABC transporter permease [Pseudomonadota bacterium]OYV58759.1 MAG: ABC transporter permease [Acidiphilium sp. 21-62-4]OYW00777.1 MAG: ABC transporter permease [Acidiphilium sp. 37-64-53]OZB27041.1 MAG: ABC transporter permease [Acidiphilium sp. 34-64-41]HQT85780.1 carbohydrate ABC transporter permease [Acidiphilium rubrum]
MTKHKLLSLGHGLFLGFIALIIIFPFYWMIASSLKTENQIFQLPPVWLFKPHFASYAAAIVNDNILRALLNSLIVTVGAVALGIAVGAPAAYGLARYTFRGSSQIQFWYVTNWMLIPVVVLIPFYLLAANLRMIDNPIVLILIYQTFVVPLVVWLLVDQFRAVPIALEEAALLDGMSKFGIFLRITLPLTVPGITVAAILAGIFAWNDLLYAFILTPGTDARTAPTVMMSYLGGYIIPWGRVMASAVMITGPVVVGGIAINKYIARGLTLGAVK